MRAARARRPRPQRDGSGLRWPGAQGAFALFTEVLWTGILVAVASLPVVTLPAALAAGSRSLRSYLRAEESGFRPFARDFRAAVAGGAVVGLGAVAVAALLAFDVLLAVGGRLPGGALVGAVGAGGLAVLAAALLLAADAWTPEAGWRRALRTLPADVRRDPFAAGAALLGVALLAVFTWQLPPLIVPALGCAVFAVVAARGRIR
ncbi:hypothetical protein [Naasia sp. SYSU D00057]|uniref:hypothetical protein n=1 Tax=Naasia sp. SYSU D00057 TaxID=2817380 RepID=UPI001FEF124B|nr:hypothetical protein [Naasia sp. SYSU D00057]